MKKSLLALTILLSVTGCIAGGPPLHAPTGTTTTQIDKDIAACKLQANIATASNPDAIMGGLNWGDIFNGCLQTKGWN